MNRLKYTLLTLQLLFSSVLLGQEKQTETVGTQQVTVIKSYTPSLSDVFKIKATPTMNDSLNNQKKLLTYKTLAIPIASTFSPNKATPLRLQKQKQVKTYNTLLAGGLGNNGQLYFDLSTMIKLSRQQSVGMMVFREGYFLNVKNSQLSSTKWHDYLGFNHANKSKYFRVDSQISLKSTRNNFFGVIPEGLSTETSYNYNTKPLIIRNSLKFLSDWEWYKSTLKELSFQANITSDNYSSSEQHLVINTSGQIAKSFSIDLHLEGLNTNFQKDFQFELEQQSQMAKVGSTVQWERLKKKFKLKVGVQFLYYLNENVTSSSLYYFPKINLSYSKPKSNFISYLDIGGDLKFNTYETLSTENPYLAPSVTLSPTHSKYNARLGIQTNAASAVSLDLSLGYDNLDNYPQYQRLRYKLNSNFSYRFSNAYEVAYLAINQFDLKASTTIDFGNENRFLFSAQYLNYQSKMSSSFLNLPAVTMNFKGQFKVADRFYLNFKTSFLGDRKAIEWTSGNNEDQQIIQLPAFISSKVNLSYHLSKQWDVFVRGKFTNSDQHARWAYFPENNFLILGGIRYKLNLNF